MSASVSMPAKGHDPAFTLKFDSVITCTLLLLPFALAMSWPHLVAVWQTGNFYDTDDAMRMVQVRDWMAGQGWFDLVAHRLDPPAGLLMHWSRVVDVPISALVRLFGLFADPIPAERLARLAFPLLLQAAMIAATAWTAKILVGPRAVMPAAFLILLSGISYGQFQPGRIDHHAPQILLLMLATGTTLRALDPRHARSAAMAGLLIALSLAISLENLPFFAILLTVPALSWALGGSTHRATLGWFAAGLGTAIPLLFVATVAPARYGIGACDAFSIAHVTGLMAGAAALGAIALASPRIESARWRWATLAVAGILVLGLVLATYPTCLHDPYAAMDPLMERLWLRNVTEAQPILTAITLRPDTFTLLACPILTGAVATLVALWASRGRDRAAWIIVTALVGAGIAGSIWEVRVTSSVGPLALLGGAWVVVQALGFAQRHPRAYAAMLPFLAMCLFSTLAWAIVPTGDDTADRSSVMANAACRMADAFTPLAGLPKTLVFSPIESGSHLLAHTSLDVIAAPYHRNQHGNLTVLQGLIAAPDDAKAIVEGTGATILTFCREDTHMKVIAKEQPDSLAARLLRNDPPSWLEPFTSNDGLFPVYRMR